MPPEGPNKSEELLKRYAKERQEQSPNLPLHPATRRLLQGEVARQFGKKSALEKRGWSGWFGIMRGRLAIGTALGAVAVTGVCVWWNNQKPQPMEMAMAERTTKELAPPSRSSADELRLKTETQIAAVDAPPPVPRETEARWRAPAAPAARAIRPDVKASQPGDTSVARVIVSQDEFGFIQPTIATTSTFSFGGSFGRGTEKSGDSPALGAVSTDGALATGAARLAKLESNGNSPSNSARLWYAGRAANFNDLTNRMDLALAYNLPAAELGAVSASAPSVSLGDNERKNQSKLLDTAKLAEEPPLLTRTEGETLNRSRRAASEPQTLATQPPTTTAQPSRTLGESLAAADKRQQPSVPSQLTDLAVQSSPARPESTESTAKYFSQSALIAGTEAAKQKTFRELARTETDPAVLSRFVIEQQGNTVRVVEADGSVYDGNVEEPVVTEFDTDLTETFAEKKDQLARQEKAVVLRRASAPPTDGYSFRASGSNVTLRQMVVVNGRFATGTNASARGANAGVAGGLSSLSRTTPTPTPRNTTNRAGAQRPAFGGRYGLATNQPATIEGTVRIGVTNQQWFRAVRDPR